MAAVTVEGLGGPAQADIDANAAGLDGAGEAEEGLDVGFVAQGAVGDGQVVAGLLGEGGDVFLLAILTPLVRF